MASLWTFSTWIVVHAVAVFAGLCAASILCSAVLALWVYSLRRQLGNAVEGHKTVVNSLLNRVQALDDRIAIVALTAAQTPPPCPPRESSMVEIVPHQGGNPADEALLVIREEIERLTAQLITADGPEGQELSSTPEG